MIESDRSRQVMASIRPIIIVVAVLSASLVLGSIASTYVLAGLVLLLVLFLLLVQPAAGLVLLTAGALLAKIDIPTGTAVVLNPTTLFVPVLAAVLLVAVLTRRSITPAASRVMLPMAILVVMALVSMLVGNATWDPFVPRGGNFLLVQLAQWALVLFSFVAFWLGASLGQGGRWLRWMTITFLVIGGLLAFLYVLPPTQSIAGRVGTLALIRAPFWLLLTAVAGGQFLFNSALKTWQSYVLGAILLVAVIYAFLLEREAASSWVGVGSTLAMLAWLRFRRLRWVALVVILMLVLSGIVFPTLWDFAGGDAEWTASGQSRLLLIERTLSVSLRNPLTGLGPVAYRNYAGTAPLVYGRAIWLEPQINSHNNYIDIFAQFGLVGLALLAWIAAEIAKLGMRLLGAYRDGFEAGYVRAMLAAGVGASAVMLFADWILPFVYNIGFPGFQASVLFWLFLGGLVALEANMNAENDGQRVEERPQSQPQEATGRASTGH